MTIFRFNVSANFLVKSLFFIVSIFSMSLGSSCSVPGTDYQYGDVGKYNAFQPTSEETPINFHKRANIDSIPNDLLIHIGSFLNNPFISLGRLNRRFFDMFHQKFILKHIVMARFNIPELEDVDGNEPELAGIFNLAWCRNDPFLIFGSLMEDISSEKRPYKVIFRSLILYLARIFKEELTIKHRDNLAAYFRVHFDCSFESHLANLCAKNGHYDLIFEFVRDIPEELIKCIVQIKNRQHLMEFFKSNPHLAIQYGSTLIRIGAGGAGRMTEDDFPVINNLKWIANCILYDAPEEFYTEILISSPVLLKRLIYDLIDSFRDAPESEYPRIQIQMIKLLNDHLRSFLSSRDFEFYGFIIDIRFGPESIQQLLDHPLIYDENELLYIIKLAIMANKRDIFGKYYTKYNTYNGSNSQSYKIMESFLKMIRFEQKKNFKLIFEVIASDIEALFCSSDYLIFIMNFYAINGFKIEGDQFIFEFVALEDLLVLGFPPEIHAKLNKKCGINSFIDKVFSYMKVVNEETVSSFIADLYMKFPIVKRGGGQCASFELIELISNSPNLLKQLIDSDIKFYFILHSENFSKYFDLPNFEGTSQIISLNYFIAKIISEMKSEDHLKKLGKLLKKQTGYDHFLSLESKRRGFGAVMTECEYFKWRLFLAYWIKSDQKERIGEITSPAIIKLLKLDFPTELSKYSIFER